MFKASVVQVSRVPGRQVFKFFQIQSSKVAGDEVSVVPVFGLNKNTTPRPSSHCCWEKRDPKKIIELSSSRLRQGCKTVPAKAIQMISKIKTWQAH